MSASDFSDARATVAKKSRARALLSESSGGGIIMRKSIISTISLSAILCVCLALQSCADTSTQTTYTTVPGDPVVASSTTTTTTTDQPDSVVGSTANAAGTIIAAPFRLVGDAIGIIF
jgi:hypothetical protein